MGNAFLAEDGEVRDILAALVDDVSPEGIADIANWVDLTASAR